MISSNAKIYNEMITNPSIVEFDYSFNELSALLTFPRPSGGIALIFDALLLLFRFFKDLILYPSFINKLFTNPNDEYTQQNQPTKIKHIGYLIKELSPSVFTQITKLVEFCTECDIPVLSISSKSNEINHSFLNVLKICLEQTNLDHKDFRIEILDSVNLETTTATNCLRDIEPTLYLILNGPLLEVDVMLTQDLSMAKDEANIEGPENVRVRFLNELTMKRFLEVVLGAHNLKPHDIERLIAQLNEHDADESDDSSLS
ncbi:hypothetical protein WICANDRAFT_64385 [Wickerhamomyces anomalus NRRL Y-366-8]|uniref:Uncharacterized protein n=1 Tax=Wickerhamomyces anomalus (strain ATCC 58044 / CBS 1984 / NCYC 433 / NRRL Y-366-8) TaxID=683960 RepID=A0A1E3NYJ8_WICAA|nr:uncharacterized protein WICANDRAFT_64385 [Wickerhamomyces anomalus NRRL Y-366-8]ODQ58246.1 hypothetical protein WICANDRAFT_64385 [Wickerhamomyces anomalus NRRL Y-366-8]